MSGQDDLSRALRAIMAAKREELDGPPTPDELVAYREGRLDPAARERLEARIAVYPEAARALADLAAFPGLEPAPGVRDVTAEEVAARWQTFRPKLPDRPTNPVASNPLGSAPAPVLRHEPRAPQAPPAHHGHPARGLAAAASVALVVGLGGGYLAGRASVGPESESSINVTVTDLHPAGEDGERSAGPSDPVELPEDSEELLLILHTDDPGTFAGYRAEIVDAQGARVWSRDGLRPTEVGSFPISFRRSALPPGTYRIDLFGHTGEDRRRLGAYELRIVEGPAGP